MNILSVTPYNIQNSRAVSSQNINFGSHKIESLRQLPKTSLLGDNEIADNILKLAKKVQFVSKILGERDKTAKPVVAKIGDASIYINMDKSQKGKIKVDLYADTKDKVYRYSNALRGYISVENPDICRQSLNITFNPKDKRMISGHLDIIDCDMDFERDIKTGKRELTSSKPFYFSPNLYECKDIQDMKLQHRERDKSCNTVTSLFFNLFSSLTKVKPEVNLIK